MGAALAWATTVVVVIAGLVALQDLGVSIGPVISSFVRAIAHLFGHPL